MGSTRARSLAFAALACALASSALQCGAGRFDGLTGGARDAGGDAAPESAASPPDASGVDDCNCEARHPGGLDLDEAMFVCWAANCPRSCVDDEPDAGDELDAGDAPACPGFVAPAVTTSCSECSRLRCCDAWNACFGDDECVALDRCFARCDN